MGVRALRSHASATPLWRTVDVVIMAVLSVTGMSAGIGLLRHVFALITGSDPRAVTDPEHYFAAEHYGAYVALRMAIQSFVLISVVVIYGVVIRHRTRPELWLNWPSRAELWSCVRWFLLLRVVSYLVTIFLEQIGIRNAQAEMLHVSTQQTTSAVITFAFVVLVLPFAEEMFFRGVLFRWMSERLNVGAGIAISSLIFGAFHGDLGGAITATLLGAGLAWMYHTHRSLWSVTLVHALYNLFAVILSYFAPVIAR